jgi:hypothetical protein
VPATAFISYSREDSEFALRLAQDLKAAGAPVWLDQLDLKPGTSWDNSIEDALMDAPEMLVILSPTSVRSENVRDEISYALKQGKTVVPVLYMECVIPLRLERKQHIDFRTNYARGLAHLLEHLRVTDPNPEVLRKAAETDANRQAAWQARDAEADRLRPHADQPPRPFTEERRVRRAPEPPPPAPQLVKLAGPFVYLGRGNTRNSRSAATVAWIGLGICLIAAVSSSIGALAFYLWCVGIITLWNGLHRFIVFKRTKLRVYVQKTELEKTGAVIWKALRKTALCKSDADVFFTRETAGKAVSFVVVEGSWENPVTVSNFQEYARRVSKVVKSRPLFLQFVDKELQIRRTLPVD